MTVYSDTLDRSNFKNITRKKKEIWLCPMTKTPIPTENSKTNGQHKNATKNFDYTTIADRSYYITWSYLFP